MTDVNPANKQTKPQLPISKNNSELVEVKNFNGKKIEITQKNYGVILVRQNTNIFSRLGYMIKLMERMTLAIETIAMKITLGTELGRKK